MDSISTIIFKTQKVLTFRNQITCDSFSFSIFMFVVPLVMITIILLFPETLRMISPQIILTCK